MNVFDYLSWRGDVPLALSPFNPVDSLVLSELSYTDFSGVLSPAILSDQPSNDP
jgi:hypothetical protein